MRLLQHLLQESAEHRPDATAIVDAALTISFEKLETQTNRMARLLRDRGLQSLDRVGVMAPKSIETVAAFIAVLKAGGTYVPLDPAGPAPRVSRMIDVAGCRLVLVSPEAEPVLAQSESNLEPVVALGALRLEDMLIEAASFPGEPLDVTTGPNDPAHILFTSGSTGLPKGVIVTHANVKAFIDWANPYFARGPKDRVSGHSPLQFDLSTYDIFGSLAAGAELHLVPPRLNLFPKDLPAFIRDRRLTQWFSAPSVLAYMARFEAVAQGDFPELRELLWCGEVFAVPALRYWMVRLPHVRFTNLYGPTEATIASTFFTLDAVPEDDRQTTPIGKACVGEEVAIVSEQGMVAGQGERGEICIAGVGVTKGYWRDDERTAKAFPPVAPGMRTQGRMYRTGDLGFVDPSGNLRYAGRADTQIKSRGHRIELGEIEVAINSIPEVAEAVILALPVDDFAGTEIVCIYSAVDGQALNDTLLRRELAKLVPRYMLPARYEQRPKLPLNSNGKIDRVQLRAELQAAGVEAR